MSEHWFDLILSPAIWVPWSHPPLEGAHCSKPGPRAPLGVGTRFLITDSVTVLLGCIEDLHFNSVPHAGHQGSSQPLSYFPRDSRWKDFGLCLDSDVEQRRLVVLLTRVEGSPGPSPAVCTKRFPKSRLDLVGTYQAQPLAPLSPPVLSPAHYLAECFGDSISMTDST